MSLMLVIRYGLEEVGIKLVSLRFMLHGKPRLIGRHMMSSPAAGYLNTTLKLVTITSLAYF